MPKKRYNAEEMGIGQLSCVLAQCPSMGRYGKSRRGPAAGRREYNEIRPHSALGYRPPAPEIIVPREELPMNHEAA